MHLLQGAHEPDVRRIAAGIRLVAFDFDGVFTDNMVYVSQDGVESVRCWRSDGLGLQRLQAAGVPAVIISTETNPVVTARSNKLRIPCHQGCDRKVEKLVEVAAAHGVPLAAVAFVGNDINDAECLQAAGLPVIVQDAHEDVLALGMLQTRTPGGRGAVREVCDYLVAQRMVTT